jgi:ribulose 1,5-bisphosphate synthetase/thiazole synthase
MLKTTLLAVLAVLGGTLGHDLNATTYDYVIVGGGTSGLTVANRLTANGKCSSPALSTFTTPN